MSLPWLNGRSHFSIGESLATPEDLVKAAQAAGLPGVLLCDTMTISGMPEFFTAARKAGIKPMLGVRLRIVDDMGFDPDTGRPDKALVKKHRAWFLRALVVDETGLAAIMALLSKSFDEAHFYAVPRLLLPEVIEAARGGGLILTLGDAYGARNHQVAATIEGCREAGIPLYADIPLTLTPLGIRQAKEALLLQDQGVPSLLSPVALYTSPEHADSLDLMAAVASNMGMDKLSPRHPVRDHVVRDTLAIRTRAAHGVAQLARRYGEPTGSNWAARMGAALTATRELADKLTFTWDKMPPSLPRMAMDEDAELFDRVKAGLADRFGRDTFGHRPTAKVEYVQRIQHELKVIKDLGFAPYFLLVQDVVRWAKDNGVRVGPGRGSVGGSLVAYVIGITDVDPMRFGLLFERFINPERIDLPDADLDFASLRREDVIQYLKTRFGEDYVAGVANYNTMQAAGALKDVCRMLGIEGANVAFSKLIPKEHGQSYSIDEALEEVPDLVAFAEKQPEVMRHARNLEGKMRAYGRHAAGMIVAGVPIRQRAVVERRGGLATINWDKRLSEDFGLVKLDILGLSTLDMLDISVEQIRQRHGTRVDLTAIPLDDPKVLDAFGRGETVGVFQFESHGMRRLLKDLGVAGRLSFSDLAVATALYRPGPMDSGLMEDFVKIRQGSRSERYDHSSMESALKETQGVMVYQEQVMQVARDFAGFSMPESDHLRKAMGKKDKAKMAEWQERFVDGAVAAHGVAPGLASEIFDKISKFAAYGFNKSHAVEYALISYQTMWLKVHYPVEFWAGVLSMLKEDRRDGALADMSRMGITLMPPDVNDSGLHFAALNDTVLLAPFSVIKGVSDKASEVIIESRASKGRFTSIADFEAKVPARNVNVAARGKLDLVGAFARIEPGQMPPDHHSRRRDQVELMPGFIREAVIIDREMDVSVPNVQTLVGLVDAWKVCERCELKGLCHPKPMLQAKARAMVVVDAPNFREEGKDEMGYGSTAESIEAALASAGMAFDEIYLTALIKTPKPKAGFPMKAVSECPSWLEEEIRILKPPVVVLLGPETYKYFFKGSKSTLNQDTGKVVFDAKRDLNILVGMNPGAIYFSPEKQSVLDEVMQKLPALLPFA